MDVIANGVNTRPITTDHEPYMTSVHVLLDFLSRLLPVASHHPLVTRLFAHLAPVHFPINNLAGTAPSEFRVGSSNTEP